MLRDTDQLLLSGNNLGSFNEAPDYLENITFFNISSSNIRNIDEKVVTVLIKYIKHLDISRNILKRLPQKITNLNSTSELWISGNPYECDCDMVWMKEWLIDTLSVQDKENVTCLTGKTKGKDNQTIIYINNNAFQ